jgi:F420-dependent oxidoreductase-like protein
VEVLHRKGTLMTKLGYQMPNFTYPGVGPSDIFANIVAQAKAADESGFDSVLVMDHFYQLPGLGDPDQIMIEAYTLLSALAQHTTKVKLGALVTGNTYRNPAVLAKMITALDIVSNGRAMCNLGAGWFEAEHTAFGIPFDTFTTRFEKLEESVQIITAMLRSERPTLDGKHYSVVDVINNPAPISRIPIMIGGGGETKTLRMVAQYADLGNLTCGKAEVPRKVEALAQHCERLGRDRSEITLSWLRRALIAPTMEQARIELGDFLATKGLDYRSFDDATKAKIEADWVIGDPDTVGEVLLNDLSTGVDGYTLNMVANGHISERVALLGTTASAALK